MSAQMSFLVMEYERPSKFKDYELADFIDEIPETMCQKCHWYSWQSGREMFNPEKVKE